jgi:SrtB family sortase
MPDLDIRRKYTYGQTRKKKRNQNPVIAAAESVLPWKGDPLSDMIRKSVMVLSVFVLVFCVVFSLNFFFGAQPETVDSRYWEADRGNTDRAVVSMSRGSTALQIGSTELGYVPDEEIEVEILERYLRFWEDNNEFVGYISIDPHINYPVAQSSGDKPNDWYLHHNFYGVRTENGSIFADKSGTFSVPTANSTGRPDNIIIHGHNLITKNGFQPLINYRNSFQFLKDNPVIRFDTLFEEGEYKIFAVYQINVEEQYGEFFPYWRKSCFNNKDDFYEFVVEALDRSHYHTDVDLRYGDELITLSTCDFSMFSATRLVIVGRRVREGETADMDTDSFVNLKANNRGRDSGGFMRYKMFDAFYRQLNQSKGWNHDRAWELDRVEGVNEYLWRMQNNEL